MREKTAQQLALLATATATAQATADTAVAQVVPLVPLVVPPAGPVVPVDERIAAAVNAGLSTLSDVPDYLAAASTRMGMRNNRLFARLNVVEPQVVALQQQVDNGNRVNEAQQALILGVIESQGTISARVTELAARLDLVRADTQNLRLDLAANQSADALLAARVTATESKQAADALALAALQAHDQQQDAALAAGVAKDAVQDTATAQVQATANAALLLGQAEHLANVAQQAQLDSLTAQELLDRARLTADEQAIAAAQATATQALQKANDDATAAATAQAAAQAAQTTANSAVAAAATAQSAAQAADARALAAQTSATTAINAAATAQSKADADALAAAAAQNTANSALAQAQSNATALAAVQTALAGKLDAALVRRGNVATPAVTVQLAQPTTVAVTFATPLASANYEVFLSKPSAGLLGIELGAQNKTAAGFTLTLRNTGLASLAVAASTVDYFAILN